jgi:hypothetical protein
MSYWKTSFKEWASKTQGILESQFIPSLNQAEISLKAYNGILSLEGRELFPYAKTSELRNLCDSFIQLARLSLKMQCEFPVVTQQLVHFGNWLHSAVLKISPDEDEAANAAEDFDISLVLGFLDAIEKPSGFPFAFIADLPENFDFPALGSLSKIIKSSWENFIQLIDECNARKYSVCKKIPKLRAMIPLSACKGTASVSVCVDKEGCSMMAATCPELGSDGTQ